MHLFTDLKLIRGELMPAVFVRYLRIGHRLGPYVPTLLVQLVALFLGFLEVMLWAPSCCASKCDVFVSISAYVCPPSGLLSPTVHGPMESRTCTCWWLLANHLGEMSIDFDASLGKHIASGSIGLSMFFVRLLLTERCYSA